MNTVIRRTPCDSFPQGYCWIVRGHPLYGRHYETREKALEAISRAVNLTLQRKIDEKGATVAKTA